MPALYLIERPATCGPPWAWTSKMTRIDDESAGTEATATGSRTSGDGLGGSSKTALVLLNHGVHLATVDDVAVDALSLLVKAGVEVLACGTCLEHLGLTDRLGAGRVTHMFEIVETLNAAVKVVSVG
jgi:intracellular sulfur oxidation DsrE/DsrF family protein